MVKKNEKSKKKEEKNEGKYATGIWKDENKEWLGKTEQFTKGQPRRVYIKLLKKDSFR